MLEFHLLRAVLGILQLSVCAVLLRKNVGYLFKFGVLMFGSFAANVAPAYPDDNGWKYFIQVPAYSVLLVMTLQATLEFFDFLRRRTFIEERSALLAFAAIVGLVPVWVFWQWPGENWYQNAMLLRQYALMWMAGGFIVAWCWLRAVRPIHLCLQTADHGEFWGAWLVTSAALASTTKYGALWRFAQWQGNDVLWRVTTDALLLCQVCICCGFLFNCWNWKVDAAPVESPDPLIPAPYQQRRLLHL